MSVSYVRRIVESEAKPWLDLGWREQARDFPPSLDEAVLILVWDGSNPPLPKS